MLFQSEAQRNFNLMKKKKHIQIDTAMQLNQIEIENKHMQRHKSSAQSYRSTKTHLMFDTKHLLSNACAAQPQHGKEENRK